VSRGIRPLIQVAEVDHVRLFTERRYAFIHFKTKQGAIEVPRRTGLQTEGRAHPSPGALSALWVPWRVWQARARTSTCDCARL
jgi:hypothetical protein